ncbi:MAG: ABC transporter ATP-binding protein [Thermoplasmata archaeon]|nr:ABC transporter ATP-binding protein [Thermoplasmata archaeon]
MTVIEVVPGRGKLVLEVTALYKHFEKVRAVDGITFSVRSGEVYGLLGPNGAGKSTALKCILGLYTIRGGRISVMGHDPLANPEDARRVIGYVPEEPEIYKSLTVRELLNFVASIREMDPKVASERASQMLTSLDADQYFDSIVATLSRGNLQKVQIIAAMLHEPDLLIMDEPLTALDAKSRRVVKEMVKLHVRRGGSVLLSTHVMEQAQDQCHRIGIIDKGRLVAEGTLDELRDLEHSAGASLEDLFLMITEQDRSVEEIMRRFEEAYKRGSA